MTFNSVLATMSALSLEMNGGPGQLAFENFYVPGEAYRYLGLWEDGTTVIRHQGTGLHDDLDIAEFGYQGTYTFASVASVPEPATLALLFFGLAGLRLKRRQKA